MTTDSIKELVQRLRYKAHCCCGPHIVGKCSPCRAADALEAMAGENERLNALIGPALEAAVSPLRKYIGELQELNKAAEAERDRLKEAIERNAQNCIDTMNKMHAQHAAERDRLKREVEQACGREQRALLQRDCSTKEAEAWREERDRLKAALEETLRTMPKGSRVHVRLTKALGGDAS